MLIIIMIILFKSFGALKGFHSILVQSNETFTNQLWPLTFSILFHRHHHHEDEDDREGREEQKIFSLNLSPSLCHLPLVIHILFSLHSDFYLYINWLEFTSGNSFIHEYQEQNDDRLVWMRVGRRWKVISVLMRWWKTILTFSIAINLLVTIRMIIFFSLSFFPYWSLPTIIIFASSEW